MPLGEGAAAPKLLVLEGKDRGQVHVLNQTTTLIGSNPDGQIVLRGKGVAARLGMITIKPDGAYLEALAEGLSLDAAALAVGQPCLLHRGAILTAAGSKLRFIAADEVFTLADGIADRAIDRRPTQRERLLKSGIAGVVALALGLASLNYFAGLQAQKAKTQAAQEAAEQQTAQIAILRQKGDLLFRQGSLDQPSGASARDCFEQILKLAPDDLYATGRLEEIRLRLNGSAQLQAARAENAGLIKSLADQAAALLALGHAFAPPGQNAKELYLRILQLDPGNAGIIEKLNDIAAQQAQATQNALALIKQAQQFIDAQQYIAPAGANAYDLLKQVVQIDPGNDAAEDAVLDMAAHSLSLGDTSRAQADAPGMLKWYQTARALGVDPQILAPRLQGARVMQQSKADVVIINEGRPAADAPAAAPPPTGFLPTAEVERRAAQFSSQNQNSGAPAARVLIDLSDFGLGRG